MAEGGFYKWLSSSINIKAKAVNPPFSYTQMISCKTNKNTVIITEEDLCKNHYRFNFKGVPFCFYTLFNFGMQLIREVSDINKYSIFGDVISRLRYVLVVGYFAACIISPRYAFESKSPETPLIIALILDAIRLGHYFDGKALIRFTFLVVITGGCLFLRKRTTWKILLNTWKEDVEEDEDDNESGSVSVKKSNDNKVNNKSAV